MNEFKKEITENFISEFPTTWSFLGSKEEADNISNEHKDQIHFLTVEGTQLINNLLFGSKMTSNMPERPFKDYFNAINEFTVTENCSGRIKKWLYNTGIPLSKYVFIDSDRSGKAIMLTWKMVVKYWEGLFFAQDLVIFDNTLEWGLFYSHNDELYFGNQIIFDQKIEEEKTIQLSQFINTITLKKGNNTKPTLSDYRLFQ